MTALMNGAMQHPVRAFATLAVLASVICGGITAAVFVIMGDED